MDTEGGASASATGPVVDLKRPRCDDDDSTTSSDGDEWLVSGSEEDEDDDEETQEAYRPFTVDDFPRVSYNHSEQSSLSYRNPETMVRGPSPAMLFPAFNNGDHAFGSDYNLGDKSETSVSNVGDCLGLCVCLHMVLLQLIDVKVAGYRHSWPGRAKIFGFIAARDRLEPLRNYVYRREVDNCESVQVNWKTGVARLSLSSPTRVISMMPSALIEFELHALSEDETEGDKESLIIEGCTELHTMWASESFIEHERLYGEKCALDVKYAVLFGAVEARVSIKVLTRAPTSGMDLKLYARTSGFGDVIRLYRGALPPVDVKMNFAVAVKMQGYLDLYMEGSWKDDSVVPPKLLLCSSWERSFQSSYHGTSDDVVKLGDFAVISVNVTWRSYLKKGRL